MKKRFFVVTATTVLTFFFTHTNTIFAQNRLEVGPAIGLSFYQGDVLGTSIPEISQNFNFAGGIHAGYYFNNYMGVHLEINRGKASGGDRYAEFPERRLRNLSFVSPVTNANLRFDWEITSYNPAEDRNFSLYGFAGGGMLFFNPKAEYQGKTYKLQPLGTEGQGLAKYPDRKPYKLYTPNLQFGGGLKFAATEQVNVAVEFSAYRAFTDYIDDVAGNYVPYTDILAENGNWVAAALSNREGEFLGQDQIVLKKPEDTRGNAKVFDYYYTTMLKVTYNFYNPFASKGAKRFSKLKNVRKCYKF